MLMQTPSLMPRDALCYNIYIQTIPGPNIEDLVPAHQDSTSSPPRNDDFDFLYVPVILTIFSQVADLNTNVTSHRTVLRRIQVRIEKVAAVI